MSALFDLDTLPSLSEIIRAHDLDARKSLGQNYLMDTNIVRKIVASASIQEGDHILEVGPGPGSLTRYLLASLAASVTVVEKDPRFLPVLQDLESRAKGRLRIIMGDALEISLKDIGTTPLKIVSNLPYNVGTPLLIRYLYERQHVSSMTLMLQKEVAQRIVAGPRTKAYGRLAVLVAWCAKAQRLFDVPASAFKPSPKVTSSIVRLIPHLEPPYSADLKTLELVTAETFGKRRKMLRGSLKSLMSDPVQTLESLGISPDLRPEDLNLCDFCKIASWLRNCPIPIH